MNSATDANAGSVESRGAAAAIAPWRLLLLLVVLAALARFFSLSKESLWFDEAISVAIARLNWAGFWDVISRFEANMALYYALLHFWIRLGDSEFMIRCLSVIAGVFSVPLLYLLGARLFGRSTGLISAALLAANAFHVRFSQEARGYSLVTLLVICSSLFFVEALERNRLYAWTGYTLTAALTVYAHLFGVLILAAQCVSVAFLAPKSVPWKRFVGSALVLGVLLSPVAVFVLTRDTGQLAWVAPPHMWDMYDLFVSFAGGGRLLVIAYCLPWLMAMALSGRVWRASGLSVAGWRYGFLLCWLFLPLSVAFSVSFLKPIFVDRFLIICLPAFVLLTALGLSQLKRPWLLAACLALILALSIRRMPWYGDQTYKEDWRGATSYMNAQASGGAGVLFFASYTRVCFDYYASRLRPAGAGYSIVFPDPPDFEATIRPDPDDNLLRSLPAKYDEVWLFLRFNGKDAFLDQRRRAILQILEAEYPIQSEQPFKGLRLLRFDRIRRSTPNAGGFSGP